MNIGEKYKKAYPFIHWVNDFYTFDGQVDTDEGWSGGCNKEEEAFEGYHGVSYSCDGEGFIEYEILAVVEMPRRYQDRVIYCVELTDPDGGVKKKSTAYMVTKSKFQEWIDRFHTSYPFDYDY
ncbi:MAG: hypothetical protein GY861_03960 [bacterium]|nr:hypothetical protein [bacterium]